MKIIKVKDHIQNLETIYECDEFKESEILEYLENIDIFENEHILEVIPCTRKEFSKGILATIRYKE